MDVGTFLLVTDIRELEVCSLNTLDWPLFNISTAPGAAPNLDYLTTCIYLFMKVLSVSHLRFSAVLWHLQPFLLHSNCVKVATWIVSSKLQKRTCVTTLQLEGCCWLRIYKVTAQINFPVAVSCIPRT